MVKILIDTDVLMDFFFSREPFAEYSTEIKIILTRNIKDFKKSELAILTPETYLKGKSSS